MLLYRYILLARRVPLLFGFDFVARYILPEAAAIASVEPMLCPSRHLREELGVKNAQSCKLVRFEDAHVDGLFLECVIQVFHHLSQTRLSGTTVVHSLFQIQKAGVSNEVVVDLAVGN